MLSLAAARVLRTRPASRPLTLRLFNKKPSDASDPFPEIFANNKKWIKSRGPDFFKKTAESQSPRILWIGCSDSRVSAQSIAGLETGEVFVHRNIANMVVGTDVNLLSVLEFSVEVLKVPHIIVCGHYGCGGVKAALEKHEGGVLGNWLCMIRDVHRLHRDKINAVGDDPELQVRKLVELNVQEQCINLYKTATVQRSLHKTGKPQIHGMVYDIKDGVLHELPVDYRECLESLDDVYGLFGSKDPK
uniref:Carbonic anhydrase n=1 Tax=Spongospora subterranea TaxID=70186 RepID=A0A0H5QG81_9EUKA|eukprot:CRZ01063.1 hypothetical protein [Spongospora subterranea]